MRVHVGGYWGESSDSDGRAFRQHQAGWGFQQHSESPSDCHVDNSARRQQPAAWRSLKTLLVSDCFPPDLFIFLSFHWAKVWAALAGRAIFLMQFTWLVSHSSSDTTRCARVVLWLLSARKWTGVTGQKAFAGGEQKRKDRKKKIRSVGRTSRVCWFFLFDHFIFSLLWVFVHSRSTLE